MKNGTITYRNLIVLLIAGLVLLVLILVSISNCSATQYYNEQSQHTENAVTYSSLFPDKTNNIYTYSQAQAATSLALSKVEYSDRIQCFGQYKSNPHSLDTIQENLNYLTALQGKDIAFVMIDIKTLSGVSYKATKPMYSKSTIKAPYVISLIEQRPATFLENKDAIKNILTLSDDKDYRILREKYGSDCLKKWCMDEGLACTAFNLAYPSDISVVDLAKLWSKIYLYNNEESSNKEVFTFMEGSKLSAISNCLGKQCKVYSKAGWDYTDETATENGKSITNDAGIIYDGDSPYIMAVFSEVPSDPRYLEPLVASIDQAHKDIVASSKVNIHFDKLNG